MCPRGVQYVTPAFPPEQPGRPVLAVNGQVVSPSAYRQSTFVELENTVAWWSSLGVLGALLVGAGILIGAGKGEVVAISGVALFIATAVLAGVERTEIATAAGVAGVVWTSAGISVALGTDPTLSGSLLGLGCVGGSPSWQVSSEGSACTLGRNLF